MKKNNKTEHTQYALGNSVTATEKPRRKKSVESSFNIFAIFCIIVVCTKILGLLANLIAILTGCTHIDYSRERGLILSPLTYQFIISVSPQDFIYK